MRKRHIEFTLNIKFKQQEQLQGLSKPILYEIGKSFKLVKIGKKILRADYVFERIRMTLQELNNELDNVETLQGVIYKNHSMDYSLKEKVEDYICDKQYELSNILASDEIMMLDEIVARKNVNDLRKFIREIKTLWD